MLKKFLLVPVLVLGALFISVVAMDGGGIMTTVEDVVCDMFKRDKQVVIIS